MQARASVASIDKQGQNIQNKERLDDALSTPSDHSTRLGQAMEVARSCEVQSLNS